MISLPEMEEMLTEIAEEFPADLFRDLNGGVLLMPEAKLSEMAQNNDLYILGQYHRSVSMGRYISIYYGSFIRVYGHLDRKAFKTQVRNTLKHEFLHHLESLAGERGLEIEDAQYMANYLNREKRKK